jgi:N-carbamoyl-L-amino-acid hydrolase
MTSRALPHGTDAAASGFRLLFDRFATCGATRKGGVDRQCATPADGAARDMFAAALAAAGAEVRLDAVGNQFGTFQLAEGDGAPLVMMGSHLDSQPLGGRFDGALGVAAAVGVGEALMATRRAGARFDADFCAVNWTNEEGARFRPSLLGSGAFAGKHDAAFALSRTDDDGVTLGAALGAIGGLGTDAPPPVPACYLELHVEQGVALETAGATIGVVTRCWGAAKFEVVFEGEQAHTGPCPMELRRDALLAAAYLIIEARALTDRWPGALHSSIGRLVVSPNSSNVVPARARLSLEIRSGDAEVLALASTAAEEAIRSAARRANVEVASADRSDRPIRQLPPDVAGLVAVCADGLGLRSQPMDTVAGHDAIGLLDLCPTGLIFVPSIGGVSHNEGEDTSEDDMEAGFAVCLDAASRLCRSGGSPERAASLGARP